MRRRIPFLHVLLVAFLCLPTQSLVDVLEFLDDRSPLREATLTHPKLTPEDLDWRRFALVILRKRRSHHAENQQEQCSETNLSKEGEENDEIALVQKAFHDKRQTLRIRVIDVDDKHFTNSPLAQLIRQEEMESFPSVLWLENQREEGDLPKLEWFRGKLDSRALIEFLNGKLGTEKVPRYKLSRVTSLSSTTFEAFTLNPEKHVLVALCRDALDTLCYQAQNMMERIATELVPVTQVKVAIAYGTSLLSKYEIALNKAVAIYFPDGFKKDAVLVTELSELNGPDSFLRDIKLFLKEETTLWTEQNVLPGSLLTFLDDFVRSTSPKHREEILLSLQASIWQEREMPAFRACELVLNKILQDGQQYVRRELARVEKLLQAGSFSDAKRVSFLWRKSVLLYLLQNSTKER